MQIPLGLLARGKIGARLLFMVLTASVVLTQPLPSAASGGAKVAEAPPDEAEASGEEPLHGALPAPALPASPELQVPIQAEATSWDGMTIPLEADGETAPIPAQSNFRLFSTSALVELRIKLVDEDGRLVPTRDRVTVGDGTNYEVRPVQPLITGSRYRLLVDGQLGPYAKDVEGVSYGSRSFGFLTEGEKPPPPPKVQAKRRR